MECRGAEWWRGAVIYQIYPAQLLRHATATASAICRASPRGSTTSPSLGVDAIWLSPFFTSPQKDFGYDIADYCAVDPVFGTLGDFDGCWTRAHALGLKVLIDQVWSHTSDRHPWFLESRAQPRRRRRPTGMSGPIRSADGTPPNNWLSVFGGSAWTWEPRRRQYYLHHFLRQPADAQPAQPGACWRRCSTVARVLAASAASTASASTRSISCCTTGSCAATRRPRRRRRHDAGQAVRPAAPRPRHAAARDTPACCGASAALMDRYPGHASRWARCPAQRGRVRARDRAYTGARRTPAHGLHAAACCSGELHWRDCAATLIAELAHMRTTAGSAGRSATTTSSARVSRWHRGGDGRPQLRPAADGAAADRCAAASASTRARSWAAGGGAGVRAICATRSASPTGPSSAAATAAARRCRGGRRAAWRVHGRRTPWLPVPDDHHALAVDAQEEDAEAVLHAFRRFLAWRGGQPAMVHGSLRPLALVRAADRVRAGASMASVRRGVQSLRRAGSDRAEPVRRVGAARRTGLRVGNRRAIAGAAGPRRILCRAGAAARGLGGTFATA